MSIRSGNTTQRSKRVRIADSDRIVLVKAIDDLLLNRSLPMDDTTSCSSSPRSRSEAASHPLTLTAQLAAVKVTTLPPSYDSYPSTRRDSRESCSEFGDLIEPQSGRATATATATMTNNSMARRELRDDVSHGLQIIMTDEYRYDDQSDHEDCENGEVSKLVQHFPLCHADSLSHPHIQETTSSLHSLQNSSPTPDPLIPLFTESKAKFVEIHQHQIQIQRDVDQRRCSTVSPLEISSSKSHFRFKSKAQKCSKSQVALNLAVAVTPSLNNSQGASATPGHYNYDYDGFVELQGISSASTTMRWNHNGSYHWKVQPQNGGEHDIDSKMQSSNGPDALNGAMNIGAVPVLMNHHNESLPVPSMERSPNSNGSNRSNGSNLSNHSNTITMEPLDFFSDDDDADDMKHDDIANLTPNLHRDDPPLLSFMVHRGPQQSEGDDNSDGDEYDERSQRYFNEPHKGRDIGHIDGGGGYHSDSGCSYTSMFDALLNKHSRTLFMLQSTKSHLLAGYLRRYGIQSALDVPDGIYAVVLSYFDDSAMRFDIRIEDLFSKSECFRLDSRTKLKGDLFTFDLNMDHQIEFVPTLPHQRRDDLNYIELSLECQYLPIKIDGASVLINILCTCHEVKYRKMDIYRFGTNFINDVGDGSEHNYNLLNRSGLQMVIPQRDIENVNALEFAITATVLDIEYDPNYDGFILRRDYNSRLTMSRTTKFEWTLSRRQWASLGMQFKQRFYSAAFDCDYWCLSCYQLNGQLLIQLNLLRLPLDVDSVDLEAHCALQIGAIEIWSDIKAKGKGMDIEYNNSFKWTVPRSVIAPFMPSPDGEEVSIVVRIGDIEMKQKQRRDIYSLNATVFEDGD